VRIGTRIGTAALVVGLLGAAGAPAVTGSGALDAAADSADLLRATCFDDGNGPPASLVAQVRDLAPVADPFVNAQLRKGNQATSTSDPTDGDSTPSASVFVNGGPGVYDVFVDKTASAEELYELTLQCWTGDGGTGLPTGTGVEGFPPAVPASGLLSGLLAFALLAGTGRWLWPRRRSPGDGARRLAGVALALALSTPDSASAHTLNNGLGSSSSATDAWAITCLPGSPAPQSLALRIRDLTPGALPQISIQLQRGTQLTNASDTTAPDAVWSPSVALNLGAGEYVVLIDKTGAGSKSYSVEYHCRAGLDGTGVETNSNIAPLQDQ
jgi:hypothetical protein